MEGLIGSRQSIRSKYAEKLMARRMAAESRREQQGRFGVEAGDENFAMPSISSDNKFEAVRGSMQLLGYLQERGVLQALVAPNNGNQERAYLDQLLHKFSFDCVENTEDGLSEDVVSSLCSKWCLPANQVMVVVSADLIPDLMNPAGIFKCRVTDAKNAAAAEGNLEEFAAGSQEKPRQTGMFQWFRTDFQQISPEPVLRPGNHFNAHYNVKDMTQLKWLFEELNGISYRPILSGVK
ncbi:uncharacterized protein LOC112345074 [Selaginella moellendorffii]|uniref:uncharacterized protein LOC112345074 n=1 Tax=Selaginella moellendorffii TaxID=88036 RepID=UPI000D1C8199|nr:uncharacterized protein LOC112345074 [Selaginella moellendorffii]|eukprot:XP_024526773.1 uncharacterized protein LOC112345074 [Selaginella moellendorffii]